MKQALVYFLTLLLSTLLWIPSEVFAAEERLIAVIMANSQTRYQDIHAVFVEKSRDFCSNNCRIYIQTPNADTMSLRNSVRKAVALGADLIVTYGPMATMAAQAEVSPVPTLFVDVYDPVGLELVSAKTKTGRNMTGVRGDAPIQALFKYFVDTANIKKLAILYDVNSREAALQNATLQDSGKRKGIDVLSLPVTDPKKHISALADLTPDVGGIFLANSEHAESQLFQVMEQMTDKRVPVITQRAGAAEAGAFMVLETSAQEQGENLAEMADQILSGTKPDDIPMVKPRKVDFVINLKAAKRFGIEVPIRTLSVASRVLR